MKLTSNLNLTINFLMIFLSFITFFLNNIFFKWMLLEIFTLLFIGYLNFNNSNKIPSLIYFFISSISSLMIFMNMIYSLNYFDNKMNHNFFLMLSLMLKLGIFPFNLWMLYMFPMLSWKEIFFMSTLAKIIPMNLISFSINFNLNLLSLLILNSIFVSLISLEETNLKKILAFSSMNHSSYMIIISFLNTYSFFYYLIIYLINSFMFIYFLDKLNFKNKIFSLNLISEKKINFISILLVFSYSMLPPFSSFMAKWFFFSENTLNFDSIFFLLTMAISSVIITWSYLNTMNYQFTLIKLTKKTWFKFPKSYYKISFTFILTISSIFFFNFYLYMF